MTLGHKKWFYEAGENQQRKCEKENTNHLENEICPKPSHPGNSNNKKRKERGKKLSQTHISSEFYHHL